MDPTKPVASGQNMHGFSTVYAKILVSVLERLKQEHAVDFVVSLCPDIENSLTEPREPCKPLKAQGLWLNSGLIDHLQVSRSSCVQDFKLILSILIFCCVVSRDH